MAWATEALDDVRRGAWNAVRVTANTNRHAGGGGRRPAASTQDSRRLKGARYALWKNPEDLTERQQEKLEWIAKTSPALHRAYLLKEGLRFVFKVKGALGT